MFQFMQSIFRWQPKPADHTEIILSDESIAMRNTSDGLKTISWDEISRITIVTTDHGPFIEDVFFVIEGSGSAMIVTHEDATRLNLMDALGSHLTGINYEQAIEAMTCTDNNSFVIFERDLPS